MFHSRNPAFRCPTGAVPDGTAVHFKITLPRDLRCSAARLAVTRDADGERRTMGMFWCGMNGGQHEFWECHYTPPEPGLYFYRFFVDAWRGTLAVTRAWGGDGALREEGAPWQLTVYRRGFTVPAWFGQGVVYQIFPDRFFRSGQKKEGVPPDRKIHETWGEQPDWAPDEQGRITNSDYFGGDLRGIEEKLGYLQSLGVTCLYLNPIFEAHSNHRYNTADYRKIDPLLGTEEDFRRLCRSAAALGIRIVLDGVFNHTGSDSVYFNREGRYPGPGAYQSKDSPYYPWYRFRRWPDDYECWWNFRTLPNVSEENPGFERFVNGPDGVVRKWLRAGASGWRLDVADELPDAFLENLRAGAKAEKEDAVLVGEVWEDASNKISYGKRRKYLLGEQLDSVMNYPFREAVLGYLTGAEAADMMEKILSILENYPPPVIRCLMNNIGTHDTERALTVLAGEPLRGHGRRWQSVTHLTKECRARGLALMRLASLMQFTLPGVPCVYYGDEAGAEGYRDPFNRACYPWGGEDAGLVGWYRRLGRLRADCPCLDGGEFLPLLADGDGFAYIRQGEKDALLCAFNRGGAPLAVKLTGEWQGAEALLGPSPNAENRLTLPALSCAAVRRNIGGRSGME
jgi:glycosidase